MKRRFTDVLEAMSYFLAGTFLLQILLDPRFGNLSHQTTVAIRGFGYGFLIVGIMLAVISISPPSIMRRIRKRIQTYSVFPLFLVTLCAIVVTGLSESLSLTLIIFYLVFISFLGISYRILAPNLKIIIKSLFGVGESLSLFGFILLWTRFVGWLLQVDLPYEFYLLILGIILFVVGCLLMLTSIIIKHLKKKSNNVEKPRQDKDQENQESTSSFILVDEPIESAEQDRLNRKQFASHFAETLIGHTDPSCLIVALYGPWGSGKSSLLNLMENNLRNRSTPMNNYITIRFNPWNISNLDQLIAMFFQELKVAVQGKGAVNKSTDRTLKLLNIFSGILSAGQLSPVGSQYFALGAEAVKKIGTTIDEAMNKSIDEIKDQLDELLSKTAKRIFILVDDIDRLDQESARLLFRMIRLNADFKNTTYLLSFDPNIVEGLLDIEQPAHGKEYLEKIVQLPINIPCVDEAIIREILAQELNNFVTKYGETKFDAKLWQELITTGRFFKYFKTLRDVVRYINGLKLNYPLISNNVNMVDFMGIEAIRVFAGESYDAIRHNKALLTRLNTSRILRDQGENIEETKKMLSVVFNPKQKQQASPEEVRRGEIVQATCKVLFPPLDTIYENWSHDSRDEQLWRQEKRICAKDIFDNYFLLGIPKGEISDEEMQTIVARSNDYLSLKETLDELFERNLGKRFLEIAEDYIRYIAVPDIEEAIVSFFEIEDKVVAQPRVMLGMSADLQTARLIYLLLRQVENLEARKRVIMNAISRSSKIFLPVYTVSLVTPDEDDKNSGRALQELSFSTEDLLELQVLCVSKIKKSADSGKLSKSPHLGMILFRWLAWGVEREVKDYVSGLVTTDEGVLDLLVGLTSEVLSDTGRYVKIDKNNVATFVDINLIESKVNENIKPKMDQLNEQQKEAVQAYLV